jgi:hypothetical protein
MERFEIGNGVVLSLAAASVAHVVTIHSAFRRSAASRATSL